MDYSCQFPQCKQLLFWWIVPGADLTAQYQQSQAAEPCSRDDELPQTHRRSRRLSARLTDAVWSEVKLNLHHECELQGRRAGEESTGLLKIAFAQLAKGKVWKHHCTGPTVNRNDEATAEKYVVLYEAQPVGGGLNDF